MEVDLAVVGAGPAGLAAAREVARRGATVAVFDEHPVTGGRLRCQLHPAGRGWSSGRPKAEELAEAARAAGARLLTETSVWGLFPRNGRGHGGRPGPGPGGWVLQCTGWHTGPVTARTVLVATGATEGALPVPGWTLPGVITAGAAQVLANVHRVLPGRRVLVVGLDPLGVAVARSLALAGAEVVGVAQAPPGPASGRRGVPARALADLAGSVAGGSLLPPPLRLAARGLAREGLAGFALRRLPARPVKRWGIPFYLRQAVTELRGTGQVTEARLEPVSPDGRLADGKTLWLVVDAVCLSGGLHPLIELVAAAGARLACVPELGGRVPVTGPDFQTTLEGVYVAGGAAGVEGADVAAAQGTLAGLAIAETLGRISRAEAGGLKQRARLAVKLARRQAPITFHPRIHAGLRRLRACWHET